jgi:tetraacyldisaccharide 4'-kinase
MIVNGETDSWKKFNLPVFSVKTKHINPGIRGKVFAFAGIGYPQKFFDGIGGLFNVVGAQSFPDHYNYTDKDIDKIMADAVATGADHIVTTEKDWVRLSPDAQEQIDYIPMETTIDKDFFKWLQKKL